MKDKKHVIDSIARADLDTHEHEYIVGCLRRAVAYCKQQFEDSCIDVLPTITSINDQLNEADKFEVLNTYLSFLIID